MVPVPVLKLVLCIIVVAGVSSGNTSIHMSTDIFLKKIKLLRIISKSMSINIRRNTITYIHIDISINISIVCILALVLTLLSI